MKNIIGEKPFGELTGRHRRSVSFVPDEDILNRDILDIGCRFGWCEVAFLKRDPKTMTGIEVSEDDLETVRENVRDERVTLAVSGATKLPFADRSFDTVVSWEVLEHIPVGTEHEMFSEVNRVLRPGGSFYFSTPNASFFSNLLDPAWLIAGHRHYSASRLTAYVDKAGLTVENVEILGSWWSIFSVVNMYVAKWLFRRSSFFNDKFVRREDEEYNRPQSAGFANVFMHCRKPFETGPVRPVV